MDPKLADFLREHGVALALINQSWVPRPWELAKPFDLITSDFLDVRRLGDSKGIEAETKTWDKTIVDRRSDLKNWVELLRKRGLDKRIRKFVAYGNNHYAGHGPATVKLFWDLYAKR